MSAELGSLRPCEMGQFTWVELQALNAAADKLEADVKRANAEASRRAG